MTAALLLGTAQWGGMYGVANVDGPPDDDELRLILERARLRGVDALDTAAAYGRSEERIGALVGDDPAWRVITKLPPDIGAASSPTAAERAVATALDSSRSRLRRPRLDGVLLHRDEHLTAAGGAVWAALRERREAGEVAAIGVSVVRPQDALAVLAHEGVEIVQVAASVLDRRFERSGGLARARELGIEVHVRSALLQGAAVMAPDALPDHLLPLATTLHRIRDLCQERGLEPATALLAWALDLPVGGVVLGVERATQLDAQLKARGALDAAGLRELSDLVETLPDRVLDPWRWPASSS